MEFKDLIFRAGAATPVISLSGSIEDRQALIVRGPSGSGKSTFLRVLARLHPAVSGTVRLEGQDWLRYPGPEWRVRLVYVAQKPAMFSGSVLDNLVRPFELGAVRRRAELNMTLIEEGLDRLMLPRTILKQDAGRLSGGETARVAVLRAVLVGPQVLLLDEPTAGLDRESRSAFYAFMQGWLAKGKRALVMVSHGEDYSLLKDTHILNLGVGGVEV
ncbi:ABC transporter ATP-binding protein [Desulforudis sp. 1031]|uniref:ABC transporter ATP-binding protein n=1 Tax=unclassified Candidatus Desulforudis TaxID=2635950 RepID=UPI003BD53B66